jgi:hypothetical protein
LVAKPEGLSYWANGPMDPQKKQWPVGRIVAVDVAMRQETDGTNGPYVRLLLIHGEEELLSDRPRQQLERVASLCRQGLRIPVAAPKA